MVVLVSSTLNTPLSSLFFVLLLSRLLLGRPVNSRIDDLAAAQHQKEKQVAGEMQGRLGAVFGIWPRETIVYLGAAAGLDKAAQRATDCGSYPQSVGTISKQ